MSGNMVGTFTKICSWNLLDKSTVGSYYSPVTSGKTEILKGHAQPLGSGHEVIVHENY